jgi:hypothetical protein
MKVEITEDEAREIAWNDSSDYLVVEEICDLNNSYKDSCPAITIVKRTSDGKHFALNWVQHVSHYGDGEHQFYDLYLYEVEQKEETKTITVKTWVNVKDTT